MRRPARAADEIPWDPAAGRLDPGALRGAHAVINFAGASVGRLPWTRAYQRELVRSRVDSTRLLAETILDLDGDRPALLNASAVGVYGNRPGETLDESSPRGEGFFPELVQAWEQAASIAAGATRVVSFRSAVVVARGGGLAPVRWLTALGLGARMGSGRQHWPWISIDDETRAIEHLLDSSLAGPVVLAGPNPATSDEVTAAYAETLHRWRLLRVPAWVIRATLGDAGQQILLDDVRVVPTRLRDDGFQWRHLTVSDAVRASLVG